MFEITLEINQKCNLKCKYCYLYDNNNRSMDFYLAKKSIEYAIHKVKLHEDKTIFLNFLGGEPLIDFELMKLIVEYCEGMHSLNWKYSVSTNGTLITKEVIDFLICYKFDIKISLDGNAEINNVNRVLPNGEGSYKLVNNNIPLLNYYQTKLKRAVQVTAVFTRETLKFYSYSLKFLTQVKGFKYISTTLDTNESWNPDDLLLLESEIRKGYRIFDESYDDGNPFYWKNFFNFVKGYKNQSVRNVCGAGIIDIYVNCEGRIYTCALGITNDISIGDIDYGVDENKIISLHKNNEKNKQRCNECLDKEKCNNTSCLYFNPLKNQLSCQLFKFYKRIYLVNQEKCDLLLNDFKL